MWGTGTRGAVFDTDDVAFLAISNHLETVRAVCTENAAANRAVVCVATGDEGFVFELYKVGIRG